MKNITTRKIISPLLKVFFRSNKFLTENVNRKIFLSLTLLLFLCSDIQAVCSWTASTVYPIPILDNAVVTVGSNVYSFAGVSNGAPIQNSYKFDGTTWTPIANYPLAVEFPSAVTDGTNIYIMGGALGLGGPQTTLYRYNVASNTYTLLAPFTTGTWNQASVYLNGKIYKFGGSIASLQSTDILEIYDVAGNSWSPGTNYPMVLSFISACVKGNFIYAAGGLDAGTTTSTNKTYRYDPVANSWNDAAIADLPLTRWGAAGSLYNGDFVVAGGYVNGDVTANISKSVLSWNLATNTWTGLPDLLEERTRMNGDVLSGSLYVIGGRSIASPNFIGSNNNQKLTCIVVTANLSISKTDGVSEYYPGGNTTYTIVASNLGPDPVVGALVTDNFPVEFSSVNWTATYTGAGATGPAGGIGNINASIDLPAGGQATFIASCNISGSATGNLVNTATIDEPAGVTDPDHSDNAASDMDVQAPCSWSESTVYPITILDNALVTLGSDIYSFGGVTNSNLVDNSYKFNGVAWTPIADLPIPLEYPSAVTDGTNIFIVGGLSGANVAQTILYRYNVGSDSYTTLAPFTVGTWNQASVFLNGKIYKFGGTSATGSTNALEIYDIVGNSWSSGANYPMALSFISATAIGNFIYAAGGVATIGTTPTNKTFRYDPVANSWDDASIVDLPATRWGAAASLYNGEFILAGGYVGGITVGNISNTVISWYLPANSWTSLPNMLEDRARMNGSVLNSSFHVIGGRSQASSGFTGTTSNQKFTCPPALSADLAITKTDGASTYLPGGTTTYEIVAANAGPDAATGAIITDIFPAAITSVIWSVSYTGGASGPPNGIGNINLIVNLPPGSGAFITAVCTISGSASGHLINTATVAVPSGVTDPEINNNSAFDDDAQFCPPVSINCPAPALENNCQSQATINTKYNAWLASVTTSGGYNNTTSNNSTGAPSACGGTKTVTFTATSGCLPTSVVSCTSSFTVQQAPAGGAIVCPANVTEKSCQTQSDINSKFTAWLNSASAGSGCSVTNNNSGPPSVVTGGTKSVTFTSLCSTPSTCVATFKLIAPIVISTSQTNVTCNGGSNGSANATVSGGVAPYQFSWSPGGSTSSNRTGLAAGPHTLTVTDAQGCSKQVVVTITEPPVIANFFTSTGPPGGPYTDLSHVSGGTGSYAYLWTPGGQTTASASGHIVGGTYSLKVTDGKGCIKTFQILHSVRLANADAVANTENDLGVKVYPNPTSGFVTIDFLALENQQYKFEVYDLISRKIYSGEGISLDGINSINYDFGNLNTGIYFIRIDVGEKSGVFKIVLER